MSQKPLLRGAAMHAHHSMNTQDRYRIQRENQHHHHHHHHHHLHQNQHQHQHQQHYYPHPGNPAFMAYNPSPSPSSNSTQQTRAYPPTGHGQGQPGPAAAITNNDNTPPFPSSDQRLELVPAPPKNVNHPPGYQNNQDAMQQLEQNLILVLKQQRQRHPRQPQHYHQPQGMIMPGSPHHDHAHIVAPSTRSRYQQEQDLPPRNAKASNHAVRDTRDYDHDQGNNSAAALTTTSTTSTIDQNKMLVQYQSFFGISPAASTMTEERATSPYDGNGVVSKEQQQHSITTPPSSSSPLTTSTSPSMYRAAAGTGTVSTNNGSLTASSRLFTLGCEVQPLSQPEGRTPSSVLSSCSDLLGGWPEEVTNDFMMNKLFHSELKLSRDVTKSTDNSNSNKDSNSPSTTNSDSNQQHRQQLSSKVVGGSVEKVAQQSSQTPDLQADFQPPSHNTSPTHRSPPKLPEIHANSTEDTTETTLQPFIQPKDSKKRSRKKSNSKGNGSPPPSSSNKSKPKRKPRLGRKPKFSVLQQDPPIEQQILALPAIVLSPSVLASIVTNDQRHSKGSAAIVRNGKADGSSSRSSISTHRTIKNPTRKRKHSDTSGGAGGDDDDDTDVDDKVSPQQFLRELLKSRGHNPLYSIELEETEYDVVPSPLQLASYGTYIAWAVQSSDSSLLRKLLGCGLSPNPCNQFRDNILGDLVCKQGNIPIYRCFVHEFDADLQVVDGFGRTPLHHCCWAHDLCRPIVEDILQRDPVQMFLKDKHEKTPLEYIRADAYGEWKSFLKEMADKYWPAGSKLPRISHPSDRRRPNGDLLDPPKALTPMLAAGVASGTIAPEAIAKMSELTRSKYGK